MSGLQRLIFENKPKISLVSANEIEGKPSYGKPQHIRLLAMKNSAIVTPECDRCVKPDFDRLSRRAILQRLRH